jgi:ABC-type transport system involved in multi-copper enzyme maturation permease subunit
LYNIYNEPLKEAGLLLQNSKIEGRTALTLLSKPVSRRQFILGKFLGILMPVAIMFVVLGALFLASVSYKVVYDARETAQADPT